MAFDVISIATKPTRRERDAARQRLAKDRAETITGNLCAVTRLALEEGRISTPLRYEALFRRVIRSELCLQGWGWTAADGVARDLVAVVLAILQVKRPSWNEGQPDYTIESGSLIKRTRCANCHKPLEGDQAKFCSTQCRGAYNWRLTRLREADEDRTVWYATRMRM